MILRASFLRWICIWLLLYAQAALALSPCVSHSAKATDAFGDMPADCPQQSAANLCFAHCEMSNQSDAFAKVPSLPALDTVVLHLPHAIPSLVTFAAVQACALHATHPPPLRLLCSLNL